MWRKGLFDIQAIDHYWGQSGQELWREAQKWLISPTLYSHAHLPTVGKALLYQLTKCPTDMPTAHSNGGSSSIEVPFFPPG